MAPKGLVQMEEDDTWKAVFEHGGCQYTVDRLLSQEAGQLVCDVLAIKEAVDAGQPLHPLQLYTQGAPLAERLEQLDPGAADGLACCTGSFDSVLEELQYCVQQLREDAVEEEEEDAPSMSGYELLRMAAYAGDAATLRLLLLLVSPDPARAPPGTVNPFFSSLHAAVSQQRARVVPILLTAMPALATTKSGVLCGNTLPIHDAVSGYVGPLSNAASTLALLLAAAPETAGAVDGDGRLPLECLLRPIGRIINWASSAERLQAARVLLAAPAAGPATLVLELLVGVGAPAHPLFADAIIPRLPLPAAAWALVPPGCAGLARALPAALEHSDEQARQLVRRLPPGDRERLRAAALCLERAQRRARVPLPSAILRHLFVLGFS